MICVEGWACMVLASSYNFVKNGWADRRREITKIGVTGWVLVWIVISNLKLMVCAVKSSLGRREK